MVKFVLNWPIYSSKMCQKGTALVLVKIRFHLLRWFAILLMLGKSGGCGPVEQVKNSMLPRLDQVNFHLFIQFTFKREDVKNIVTFASNLRPTHISISLK